MCVSVHDLNCEKWAEIFKSVIQKKKNTAVFFYSLVHSSLKEVCWTHFWMWVTFPRKYRHNVWTLNAACLWVVTSCDEMHFINDLQYSVVIKRRLLQSPSKTRSFPGAPHISECISVILSVHYIFQPSDGYEASKTSPRWATLSNYADANALP